MKHITDIHAESNGKHTTASGTLTNGNAFRCYRGGARSTLFVEIETPDGFTDYATSAAKQCIKRESVKLGV